MVCYVVGLIFKRKAFTLFIGCLKHPVYLGSACDPDFSFGLPDVIVLSSLFGRTLFCGGYLFFLMYFTLTFHIMISLVLPMISKVVPVSYEEDIEQYISLSFFCCSW